MERKYYEVQEPTDPVIAEECMFSYFVYEGERFWSPEDCAWVAPTIIERLWPWLKEIDELVYKAVWEGRPYGCAEPGSTGEARHN